LMSATSNPVRRPTKTGYIFAGYYADTNNGEVQMIDARGNITSNLTSNYTSQNMNLYAKWTPITYTVTYVANKALSSASQESIVLNGQTPSNATITGLPAPETFTYDDETHGLSADVPVSTLGRVFVGWKLSVQIV